MPAPPDHGTPDGGVGLGNGGAGVSPASADHQTTPDGEVGLGNGGAGVSPASADHQTCLGTGCAGRGGQFGQWWGGRLARRYPVEGGQDARPTGPVSVSVWASDGRTTAFDRDPRVTLRYRTG